MSSWAVYSLLHFPSRYRDSTLWSALPCGVRTFLPAFIRPAAVCSGQTEIKNCFSTHPQVVRGQPRFANLIYILYGNFFHIICFC